jgi:sporulation protein YlmC with PRC-barrel domain
MLMLNSQLLKVPIMSLQSGGSLGTASEEIVDPRKLKVVAYRVSGPRINEASILHTSDIREVGPLGFIVDSTDEIMVLDDSLVRLNEVIDFHFQLIGKQVVDDTKKKLGKVIEYAVESESFLIQKLHVSQNILKNVKNSNLIIHRSQIVEISDKTIIVRSATVESPTTFVQAINPFRKSAQSLAPEQRTPSDTTS